MKPEKLSELLQNIDEGLIARAGKRRRKSKAALIRIIAVCACLVLVMTVTLKLALQKPEVFDKDGVIDNAVTDDGTDGEPHKEPEEISPIQDGESAGSTAPGTDNSVSSSISDDSDTAEDRLEQSDKPTDKGNGNSALSYPVAQAADPYPHLTKNVKFNCGSYTVEQYGNPDTAKDITYLVYYSYTGEAAQTMSASDEVSFDGIPIIPYAAKTVLKPTDGSLLTRISDKSYNCTVFRGVKSGLSTQYVSVNGKGELNRVAYTPVTVTRPLYGNIGKDDTVRFAENAAVVEYEGKARLLCADGLMPIKSDTEYIFIAVRSDTVPDLYSPASPDNFCVFEITDEVRNARSADGLKGLTDAEKEIYQRYYYDTL